MCYTKPGPRCSNHATKTLAKAQAAYAADNSDSNGEALAQARHDYNLTPKGVKELRDEGIKQITNGNTNDGIAAVRQADAYDTERTRLIGLVGGQKEKHATADIELPLQNHQDVKNRVEAVTKNASPFWFRLSEVDVSEDAEGQTQVRVTMNASDGGFDSGQPEIAQKYQHLDTHQALADAINGELNDFDKEQWDAPKEVAARAALTKSLSNDYGKEIDVTFVREPYTDVDALRAADLRAIYAPDDADEYGNENI
jgi:hypothetical protein